MKSVQDIDNEYSAYLGDEIASINEFTTGAFIEIDHRLISAKIDVQIKNGTFLGVDNVGYFHSFDNEGNSVGVLYNDNIKLINEIIELIPSLEQHIISQAYKQFEDENDN